MATTNDRYLNSATPGVTSRTPRSGFWWPFCLDEIDSECAQLVAKLAHHLELARGRKSYSEYVIRTSEERARRAGMPEHMKSREFINPRTHRLDWEWIDDTERWSHAVEVQLTETTIEHLTTLIEAAYVG
jgi:hypothetical protein